MTRRGAGWSLAALVTALAVGCNRTDGRIPVTGSVTLDGAPATGIFVRFYAALETKGNGGYAYTDAAGRFTATTLQARPGLYPGEYAVTLGPPEEGPGQEEPAATPVRIPGGYSNPETTPLKVTVTAPRADLTIEATNGKK
jgi:hypothetical protein